MKPREIAHTRLRNQHLVGPPLATPEAVVRALGAVQAQDYSGAKWAIALRMRRPLDADIEKAFQAGRLIRTHVLRPTWHFVLPEDLRWMLALSAPRIRAAMGPYNRPLDLDARTFATSNAVIAKALAGGKRLTREELSRALAAAKIKATGPRLGHLMMEAEVAGIACSGPRRGKQFTYALVDEWVPAAKPKRRDEALVELAQRYFTSRGPATANDFAWWSGLTVKDAKEAITLAELPTDGDHAFVQLRRRPAVEAATLHLLPNFDEYFIGFKDRRAFAPPDLELRADLLGKHIVFASGQIIGGWHRTLERKTVVVHVTLLAPLTKPQRAALDEAAERFASFLGLAAKVITSATA